MSWTEELPSYNYSFKLSAKRGIPEGGKESEEEMIVLKSIRETLLEITGGCEVCQRSVSSQPGEELFCTVHNRPGKRGDSRCEFFSRKPRRSDLAAEPKTLAREYLGRTYGMGNQSIQRLTGPV